MKKVLFLLSVIVLITGCSIKRLDDKKTENVVATMMNQKIKTANVVGRGYKYYLPMGVIRQNIDNYNEKLYSLGDTYYLFIDVVGYLNKKKITTKEDKNAYYYKSIDNGYITVLEENGEYLVKCYYNYAFIESYVKKENINMALVNILSILKTIKFKTNILTYGNSEEIASNYEETFKIVSNNKKEVDFLSYEKEYDKYDEEINLSTDEEQITDLEEDIITKDTNE